MDHDDETVSDPTILAVPTNWRDERLKTMGFAQALVLYGGGASHPNAPPLPMPVFAPEYVPRTRVFGVLHRDAIAAHPGLSDIPNCAWFMYESNRNCPST